MFVNSQSFAKVHDGRLGIRPIWLDDLETAAFVQVNGMVQVAKSVQLHLMISQFSGSDNDGFNQCPSETGSSSFRQDIKPFHLADCHRMQRLDSYASDDCSSCVTRQKYLTLWCTVYAGQSRELVGEVLEFEIYA